jgi:hypothetical protein
MVYLLELKLLLKPLPVRQSRIVYDGQPSKFERNLNSNHHAVDYPGGRTEYPHESFQQVVDNRHNRHHLTCTHVLRITVGVEVL